MLTRSFFLLLSQYTHTHTHSPYKQRRITSNMNFVRNRRSQCKSRNLPLFTTGFAVVGTERRHALQQVQHKAYDAEHELPPHWKFVDTGNQMNGLTLEGSIPIPALHGFSPGVRIQFGDKTHMVIAQSDPKHGTIRSWSFASKEDPRYSTEYTKCWRERQGTQIWTFALLPEDERWGFLCWEEIDVPDWDMVEHLPVDHRGKPLVRMIGNKPRHECPAFEYFPGNCMVMGGKAIPLCISCNNMRVGHPPHRKFDNSHN